MVFLNIRTSSVFLFIVILIIASCNSAKKEIDMYFDEVSSKEFKIKKTEFDAFLPFIQVIGYEHSEKMGRNMSNNFVDKFHQYYSKDTTRVISELRGVEIISNCYMDSIKDKNSLFLPKSLRKYINKEKKYSLISNYNGYLIKNRVDFNIFIFDNETFEKVYYSYSVFPTNIDNGSGLNEYEKLVYTRFLEKK